MVGDPGIEPGMGLPGGVTVRCRTLQLVARIGLERSAPPTVSGCLRVQAEGVNRKIRAFFTPVPLAWKTGAA